MNKGLAKAVHDEIGIDVAVGYAVFLILALSVSVVSKGGFVVDSITLADLLSGSVGLSESSGKGLFVVLLATATIAVPYFWRHKFAPLAFTVPMLCTIYGFWPLYEQHRAQVQATEAMGELSQILGQMAEQLGGSTGGPFDSLGIGAWLLFATVIYVAFKGLMRFLSRA